MSAETGNYAPLLRNVQNQGGQFARPLAEDNKYYGFLCKADKDESTGTWQVFFELVNKKFLDNVLFNRPGLVAGSLPQMPALAFHILAVDEPTLVAALNLTSAQYIAEGSWYELELTKGEGQAEGQLYDPDIDGGGPRKEAS
ncbi:MAG TPA: hypothetical protein VFI17_10475 [Solirubrobacterales bacterium]|nr:hypothetical protein [Solirubrobacterales bacterium]